MVPMDNVCSTSISLVTRNAVHCLCCFTVLHIQNSKTATGECTAFLVKREIEVEHTSSIVTTTHISIDIINIYFSGVHSALHVTRPTGAVLAQKFWGGGHCSISPFITDNSARDIYSTVHAYVIHLLKLLFFSLFCTGRTAQRLIYLFTL